MNRLEQCERVALNVGSATGDRRYVIRVSYGPSSASRRHQVCISRTAIARLSTRVVTSPGRTNCSGKGTSERDTIIKRKGHLAGYSSACAVRTASSNGGTNWGA